MSYQIVEGFTKVWESPTTEVHFDRRGMPLRRNRHKASSSQSASAHAGLSHRGILRKGLTALLAEQSREMLVQFSQLHETQACLNRK